MGTYKNLNIGTKSINNRLTIIDEDRLCYRVKSENNGAFGIRTISKSILQEFIDYLRVNPNTPGTVSKDELSGKTENDKFEYGYNATYTILARMALDESQCQKVENICEFETLERAIPLPLQCIYFGAPGTGKSYEIKKQVKKHKSFRITFHPDTDYSSFVGAYKPTSIQVPMLATLDSKAIPMKDEQGNAFTENKIVYTYVKQAFLNAYIEAWKEQENETPKPVFLVIEEINRGNCAQIFGDIFQLLDRNDAGFSDYSIVPDSDLSRHVSKDLKDLNIANREKINAIYEECEADMVGKVLNGEVLLLPNNLYIWATMNTSDQSLFPIDSAFKRRWDWKYIKIADAHKGWQIKVGTKSYDWWQFVQAINHFVFDATQSEDKNLGYFFAKAKDDAITAETFVSKVIFYLYTDVFKDYGFSGDIFKSEKDEEMTFQSFYTNDGKPCEAQIIRFIKNVIYSNALPDYLKAVEPADDEDMNVYDEDELDDNTSNSSSARHKVSVGDIQCSLRRTFFEITRQAIKANPSMTLSDLITTSNMCDFVPPQRNNLFLEASKIAQWQEDHADDNTANDRYYFKLSDYLTDAKGLQFVVYAQWSKTPQVVDALIKYAENLNVNVELV